MMINGITVMIVPTRCIINRPNSKSIYSKQNAGVELLGKKIIDRIQGSNDIIHSIINTINFLRRRI